MSVFDQMGWSSKGAEGTGNSVGNAQGRITIDTSSFAAARSAILKESKALSDAVRKNLGDVSKAAAQMAKVDLENLKQANKIALLDYRETLKARAQEARAANKQETEDRRAQIREIEAALKHQAAIERDALRAHALELSAATKAEQATRQAQVREIEAALKHQATIEKDALKAQQREQQTQIKAQTEATRARVRAAEQELKSRQRAATEALKIEKQLAEERAAVWDRRMTAVGAAATATVGLGLTTAQDIKVLRAQFKLFYGDQRKSNAEMERLRDLAEKLNQPFLEVLRNATELIPAVKGTTAELSQATIISQKLATLLPEMANRAGFALREFSVGQYMSLTRVFNLNREKLKEILDLANGDVKIAFDLLDEYLGQLGVTTERLAEVGRETNAFKTLKSELQETLATGFMPMRDALSDITWGLNDMLRTVRELHPDLLKLAATLTAIVAVSQSGRVVGNLPMIGKFAGSLGLPKVSAGTLGRAGVYGGAIAGGALLGTEIVKSSGIDPNYSLRKAGETLAQILFLLAKAVGEVVKGLASIIDWVTDGLSKAGQQLIDALGKIVYDIAKILSKYGLAATPEPRKGKATPSLLTPVDANVPFTQGYLGKSVTETTAEYQKRIGAYYETQWKKVEDSSKSWSEKMADDIDKGLIALGEAVGIIKPAKSTLTHGGLQAGRTLGGATGTLTMTDELLDEWQKFQQDLFDIAVEYNQKITDLTLEHNSELADLNQKLGDDLVQAAADEQERYLEALQKARDSEAEIRLDLADKLAEDDADLADKLLEINDDYQKADEKAVKDHLKALKDIQEEGRLAILSAAARLDGVAVWEAMQRMQKQLKDEQDSFQDERKERQKKLDDQLADELKAHDKSALQDQQAADKKITKLWEQYRKEEAAAVTDYNQKLADLRKNFTDQQTEYGKQYTQRLNQLIAQGASEKQQAEDNFTDTFNAIEEEAGLHEADLLKIHQEGNTAIETQLTTWYEGMKAKFAGVVAPTAAAIAGGVTKTYQGGGRLAVSGIFKGERGETMLRQDTTRQISRMLGDNWTPSSLTAALAGGSKGGRGPVGPIAINIYGETRRSDAEIENLVRRELVTVFEGL
jgi:hypothetical protein